MHLHIIILTYTASGSDFLFFTFFSYINMSVYFCFQVTIVWLHQYILFHCSITCRTSLLTNLPSFLLLLQDFLSSVQDKFLCVCCQELVFQPVTTDCGHNVCKTCLQRSFKAEVFTCPACRHNLGKDHKMQVNKPLSQCLLALFPGYDASR